MNIYGVWYFWNILKETSGDLDIGVWTQKREQVRDVKDMRVQVVSDNAQWEGGARRGGEKGQQVRERGGERDEVWMEEWQHLDASEEKQTTKDQERTEPREGMIQEFQEAESNQQSMLGRQNNYWISQLRNSWRPY